MHDQINVRVDNDFKRRVIALAREKGLSLSDYVKRALVEMESRDETRETLERHERYLYHILINSVAAHHVMEEFILQPPNDKNGKPLPPETLGLALKQRVQNRTGIEFKKIYRVINPVEED